MGGRVSDKFDDSAVAVWVPIAKWDGFGANRPSRTNRRRPDGRETKTRHDKTTQRDDSSCIPVCVGVMPSRRCQNHPTADGLTPSQRSTEAGRLSKPSQGQSFTRMSWCSRHTMLLLPGTTDLRFVTGISNTFVPSHRHFFRFSMFSTLTSVSLRLCQSQPTSTTLAAMHLPLLSSSNVPVDQQCSALTEECPHQSSVSCSMPLDTLLRTSVRVRSEYLQIALSPIAPSDSQTSRHAPFHLQSQSSLGSNAQIQHPRPIQRSSTHHVTTTLPASTSHVSSSHNRHARPLSYTRQAQEP